MAERYLTRDALDRALQAGRDALKWLVIEHERDGGATLRVREVLDVGRDDLMDVYEFAPYDWEAEDGITMQFPSPQAALEYATSEYGANPGRFVNQGVVQFEYEDYRKSPLEPTVTCATRIPGVFGAVATEAKRSGSRSARPSGRYWSSTFTYVSG